jgi:hypothetical protein
MTRVPGSNLLNTAMGVIAKQTVVWHQFIERTVDDYGIDVSKYAAAKTIRGSWQPVPRRLYQTLGLDFNKIYVTFYASKDILDVQRDVAGDQVTFCGMRYQVLQANDWNDVDGWTAVLLIQVGDKDAG